MKSRVDFGYQGARLKDESISEFMYAIEERLLCNIFACSSFTCYNIS